MINDTDDVAIGMDELKKVKPKNFIRPRVAGKTSPFICMAEILEIVPVSKTTFYNMNRDGRFPKQKSIGGRAAVWSREEVMRWVSEKLA